MYVDIKMSRTRKEMYTILCFKDEKEKNEFLSNIRTMDEYYWEGASNKPEVTPMQCLADKLEERIDDRYPKEDAKLSGMLFSSEAALFIAWMYRLACDGYLKYIQVELSNLVEEIKQQGCKESESATSTYD